MKFKRYDKRFLPMLFIGLGIWVSSIVITYFLDESGQIESQTALMGMVKSIFQSMPVFTLLLLCLFQPVLEEFSFRLWGVGKKWMTIVCLVLMALFAMSEMGLWALFFIGGFIVVWLLVKDGFKQRWINALITSACFAFCHLSGFGSFGWGMVLGLLDIFGMALVMCWLTINLSFWFSCLLHVGNNSLAILWPLLFVPDPVANTYTMDDGSEFGTELRVFKPLSDDRTMADLYDADRCVYVGEPAEIAYQMLQDAKWNSEDFSSEPFYDWVAKNENIEERVVYTVHFPNSEYLSSVRLLECFMKDYEAYSEEVLVLDTTEAELEDIYLVYLNDSLRVNINNEEVRGNDFALAQNRVEYSRFGRSLQMFVPYSAECDSVVRHYALTTTRQASQLDESMAKYDPVFDLTYGFSLEYVPTGKKVKLVTVK